MGIKNYFLVLTDTRALDAYFFTFRFAIITTIIVNALSLILALALNSKIRFRNFFKAVFFFPNILSILIVSYIFKYIFTYLFPQAASALASSGLITAEIGNVLSKSILGNSSLAWLGVVFVQAWQAIALNTVLYLAGLQTVSEELYEVADIDGASGWQKFRHITFPLIAPFFTINMVLALKNFLMVFDSIMGLTSGGPGRATESISVLIYNGGFLAGEFAYQSANAIIYFLVIASISFIQLRFLNRREEKIYEK